MQFQDASGFSTAVHGTAGPNCGNPATCSSSQVGETPNGDSFRVRGDKVQVRIAGRPNRPAKWVNMRKVTRKGTRKLNGGPARFMAGGLP